MCCLLRSTCNKTCTVEESWLQPAPLCVSSLCERCSERGADLFISDPTPCFSSCVRPVSRSPTRRSCLPESCSLKKKSPKILCTYIAQDPRTTPTLLCQYYCICIFLMRVPGDVFISFDYLPTVRLSQATPKMIFDFSKHEHTTFSPSPLAVDGASRTPSSPSSLPIQPRRYQYLLYTDQSVRTSLSASRRTGR